MQIVGRQPNAARRVEVSLAARGFRECWALDETPVPKTYMFDNEVY